MVFGVRFLFVHVCKSGQSQFRNNDIDLLFLVGPTCSLAQLEQGLMVGMAVNSSGLVSGGAGNSGILSGSWISIYCIGNYKWNPLSGPLNITCQSTGQWTTFPICSL